MNCMYLSETKHHKCCLNVHHLRRFCVDIYQFHVLPYPPLRKTLHRLLMDIKRLINTRSYPQCNAMTYFLTLGGAPWQKKHD